MQKTKKVKKKKEKSLSKLKKEYWKLFSIYIRKKSADENGLAKCVTCGIVKPWQELQAGHYVPASAGLSTYFEETNVHCQCVSCNLFKKGNMDNYALFMIKTYGREKLDELAELKRQDAKFSKYDYLRMIETISQKLGERI